MSTYSGGLAREHREIFEEAQWHARLQAYQILENVHCLLQDALNKHPVSVDPVEEALALVKQARENYAYLNIHLNTYPSIHNKGL